jgi:uncharacterized membrane protein YphA (DoxX/SURF4 family)
MNAGMSAVAAVGRFLLALIFVRAGINKLGAIAATSANMSSHGIQCQNFWFMASSHWNSAAG